MAQEVEPRRHESVSRLLSESKKIKWSEVDENEQKHVQKEFLDLIKDGNIQDLKRLLEKLMENYTEIHLEDWEYVNNHRDRPLHLAAYHGHLHIVKFLVREKNCYSDRLNRYKNTPLHRAARQGQLEVVKYLVEDCKCDPMCLCNWGRTPLHHACNHNQLEVVKYLMECKGVDVNVRDKRKRSTPLDLAAESGSSDVVIYMTKVKKCYDPSLHKCLDTPLHHAAFNGREDVVQYLVSQKIIQCKVKGKHGRTPLHSACKGGHLGVIKYLFGIINDVKAWNNDYHQTPLDIAAKYASVEVLKYMIDERRDCEITYPYENKYSTLHHAAYGGKLENVKFLIGGKHKEHLTPNCKGWKGKTPLHSACRSGKNDVVEYLVMECNVDPLVKDDSGNTPLHSAAKNGDRSVVELLLSTSDCDPGVVNNVGQDAAAKAKDFGHNHTYEYLMKASDIHKVELRQILKRELNYVVRAKPEGMISKGNFASVLEVKVSQLNREIAGKVFKSGSPINPKEIITKVKVVIKFDHKNIIRILDAVCFLPQTVYPVLLMEKMSTSLKLYLQQTRDSTNWVQQALKILQDVACGLEYLHHHNPPFIHRHLTAENVLLDEENKAKIGGFYLIPEHDLSETMEYTPPEATLHTSPSYTSYDVFSFGHLSLVVLLRKSTLRLEPFQMLDDDSKPHLTMETDRRKEHIKEVKKLILSENQSQLLRVIEKSLNNSPKQRPDMQEILEVLQKLSDQTSDEPMQQSRQPKDEVDHEELPEGASGEYPEIIRLCENLTLIIRTVTAGEGPQHFANKLVEKTFLPHRTAQQILNALGSTPDQQASRLMETVFTKIEQSERKDEQFKEFVDIFSSEPAYDDLVKKLNGGKT